MTHSEVYAELDKDRDNVARWFDYQAMRLRRQALKTQKFPVTWWLDYTSPRKNRYLISVTCTRRNYDRFHGLTILALKREERGYSVYLSYIGKHSLIRKTVFLQHVFDRYAERGNVQKKGIDLIKQFFDHQSNGHIIDNPKLAGRSVRYNGRDHRFVAVNDGVILGDVDNGIFIARTFITYEMATGKQHEAFAEAKKDVNTMDEELIYVRDSQIRKNRQRKNLIKI